MKIYSFNPQYEKLLKKNCKELDNEITGIVNYIDNFMPNYVILNRKYITDNISASFYPTDNNGYISGIISSPEDSSSEEIIVDLTKMLPHQIVENTFGQDIKVNAGQNIEDIIPQGYAVCHDGYDSNGNIIYSIIPLSPSGGYYIVSNIQPGDTADSIKVTFIYDDRAIDKYGMQDVVSFCLPGSRFFYSQDNKLKNFGTTLNRLEIENYDVITDSSEWNICCAEKDNPENLSAVWNKNFMLSHDIIYYKENKAEDVFIDESIETSQVRVGESPKSSYIINTNLKQSNISNDLFVNLY